MKSHIPSSAGVFRVVREKRQVRGRTVRVSNLVFTSHDGFVVERPMHVVMKAPRTVNEEMYAEANAIRGRCVYQAQMEAAKAAPAPKAWERCAKPAPVAVVEYRPSVAKLSDSELFSAVEARGYEVHVP